MVSWDTAEYHCQRVPMMQSDGRFLQILNVKNSPVLTSGKWTKTKSRFTKKIIILKRDSAEPLHFCFVINYESLCIS